MHNHAGIAPLYRPAAYVIGAATALALVALAHHPVGRQVTSAHAALAHIDALAAADQATHGALIALYMVLAAGHAVFAVLLGLSRPPVLVAITAYFAGCCLLTGAMLLDGFVTPQLAHQFVAAPEAQAMQVHVVLAAIGVSIQVLSKAGLLALSLSFIAFACALASGRPRLRGAWPLAVVAFLAGALPAVIILTGSLWLAPGNLMVLLLAQAVWQAGMAWALFVHAPAPARVHAHNPVDAQS